jgi:tryptophan 2,3-dioxygenase
MNKHYTKYFKLRKVIKSCKTIDQLNSAIVYIYLYLRTEIWEDLAFYQVGKQRDIINGEKI